MEAVAAVMEDAMAAVDIVEVADVVAVGTVTERTVGAVVTMIMAHRQEIAGEGVHRPVEVTVLRLGIGAVLLLEGQVEAATVGPPTLVLDKMTTPVATEYSAILSSNFTKFQL